ncbi:MAG TPA: DNA replication/repair protein RecF [Candidatus Competibacteraceae bacterium]|nr:DNA replication/repair protein RecF [Candidatus Competibacteraceae bacterium]
MILATLEIEHFRNLTRVALECSPGLNLVVGENASGKTSLLEAIYYLGRARSFRSASLRELIQHGAEALRITATLQQPGRQRRIRLGLQRSPRETVARLDGRPLVSLAELAEALPLLLLNPDSHRLLEEGPRQRRRFLDWGLFHAEPGFLEVWRRYTVALRHRNAALRQGAAERVVAAWDGELAAAALQLDPLRQNFCRTLEDELRPLLAQLLGPLELSLDYRRGWGAEFSDLRAALHHGREQDRRYGHTRLGPHRADFEVRLDGRPVTVQLSRGQQKLLVAALVLAQARLYQRHRGQPCVLLIDDLPAELDPRHRARIMTTLAEMDCQLFVTALEDGLLDAAPWREVRLFHIRQGVIRDATIFDRL